MCRNRQHMSSHCKNYKKTSLAGWPGCTHETCMSNQGNASSLIVVVTTSIAMRMLRPVGWFFGWVGHQEKIIGPRQWPSLEQLEPLDSLDVKCMQMHAGFLASTTMQLKFIKAKRVNAMNSCYAATAALGPSFCSRTRRCSHHGLMLSTAQVLGLFWAEGKKQVLDCSAAMPCWFEHSLWRIQFCRLYISLVT